jgi:hypothetical protein
LNVRLQKYCRYFRGKKFSHIFELTASCQKHTIQRQMINKYLLSILLPISLSCGTSAQSDEYGKFIQAILKGDTALAAKIEKRNVTVETVKEKPFPTRNVAEHVFPFNIKKLKDTIAALFNIENQYDDKFLKQVFYNYMADEDTSEKNNRQIVFSAETKKDALFGKPYFANPKTTNDIYIHAFGETWFSKFYVSKGKPLETRTAFIIKLSAQDANSTKVAIVAESPTVLNGIAGFGVHGPVARETKVQPSSIEEYTLLLFIANKLDDKNLEPLRLPHDK